jgi:transglutaminase-like putative cysteine protease
MSDGNGEYQITIYINVSGNSYAAVLSLSIDVSLADEFEPFLRSNQYVNFDEAPETLALAAQLTADKEDTLDKVKAVYDYVVENIKYDNELAATVKSGYVPVLDRVLEKQAGICFDYASLMTGMLRSQGIPCKLVVGYAGELYHAWINVWTEDSGWVDNVIFFDGTSWVRMDPTFAASGSDTESSYTAKYFY